MIALCGLPFTDIACLLVGLYPTAVPGGHRFVLVGPVIQGLLGGETPDIFYLLSFVDILSLRRYERPDVYYTSLHRRLHRRQLQVGFNGLSRTLILTIRPTHRARAFSLFLGYAPVPSTTSLPLPPPLAPSSLAAHSGPPWAACSSD